MVQGANESVGEAVHVLVWIEGLIQNHKLTSSCRGVKNGRR